MALVNFVLVVSIVNTYLCICCERLWERALYKCKLLLQLLLLLLLLCLYWGEKTELKRAPHTAKFTLYQMFVKALPLSLSAVRLCLSFSSSLLPSLCECSYACVLETLLTYVLVHVHTPFCMSYSGWIRFLTLPRWFRVDVSPSALSLNRTSPACFSPG